MCMTLDEFLAMPARELDLRVSLDNLRVKARQRAERMAKAKRRR